jgi:hypothetical protein
LKSLVKEYSRKGCQLEYAVVELKEQFAGDPEAWLNLERQLTGFANVGGGIIVFGLTSSGDRVGIKQSLATHLDPANLLQKLQKNAPNASISTAYLEVIYYRKRYGFLLIGKPASLIIFDKVGNVTLPNGKVKTIIQPGVVYVRVEGATREARQADLDRLLSDRIAAGLQAFLARIEKVATLPPGNELLARSPGSDQAYILAPGGQGIPVKIEQELGASAVTLTEVLSPQVPLSSLDAEVVGQLRQWHADPFHRVPRATLMRWYLSRTSLSPIPECAVFCFLSAIHDRGYCMYWASKMDRAKLEEVIRREVEDKKYPENRVVPYIIGSFFFSRRNELIDEFAPNLSSQLDKIVDRLRSEVDVKRYLTNGRLAGAVSIRIGSNSYDLEYLMSQRSSLAQELFDDLMTYYPEGNVPPEGERQAAHQLDMLVHGDLDS